MVEDMRMLPQPVTADPDLDRRHLGAGAQARDAAATAGTAAATRPSRPRRSSPRLRAQRPDRGFAISLRYGWNGRDDKELRARLEGYEAVGVEHVLVEPAKRELSDWLAAVERIARAGEGMLS